MGHRRDLSFVAPHRRAEVLRRIEVLERFLRAPGRKAADDAAASLGLGKTQFYSLAQICRDKTSRPHHLAGFGRQKTKRTTLTPEQVALFVDADREMPRSLAARVVDRAVELGVERGVIPASRVIMHKHLTRLRAGRATIAMIKAGVDYVVDHCAVNLAVLTDDGLGTTLLSMPIATIVFETGVDSPKPIDVALALGLPGPIQMASALAHALSISSTSTDDGCDHHADEIGPKILINSDRRTGWDGLWSAMAAAGVRRTGRQHPVVPGGVLTRSFLGDRLLGLPPRPQSTHKTPADRRPKPRAGQAAMTVEDAEALLREDMEAGAGGTSFRLDRRGGRLLRSSLLSLTAHAAKEPDLAGAEWRRDVDPGSAVGDRSQRHRHRPGGAADPGAGETATHKER